MKFTYKITPNPNRLIPPDNILIENRRRQTTGKYPTGYWMLDPKTMKQMFKKFLTRDYYKRGAQKDTQQYRVMHIITGRVYTGTPSQLRHLSAINKWHKDEGGFNGIYLMSQVGNRRGLLKFIGEV